ncbi:MAG: ABC transporter permease, partial [Bacteroidales bacterium]|nr:ABC transporter permease [Bacteroidales bacterium]
LHGHGVSRVIFGRGLVYWLLFMAIGIYIATIVPAVIGLPQRGNYWDIMLMLVIFVSDCVVFSQFWSSFINKRETVFVLLLFISPICLFLSGFSWPSSAIPPFWRAFSWLFPSTFGCQAFINLNTAGSTIVSVRPLLHAMITQLAIYYALSCVAMYVEQQVIKRNA